MHHNSQEELTRENVLKELWRRFNMLSDVKDYRFECDTEKSLRELKETTKKLENKIEELLAMMKQMNKNMKEKKV